jgi:enolase
MKVIKCNTPNGQFQIPLKLVAENRADYYAVEVDGNEKKSQEWQEEVDWVMKDDFEGIDWLINNSNWEDWQDSATKLNDKVKVTDDDFWCSSDDFEIVEAQE